MNLPSSQVARNGAWTRWASVLCVECEHAERADGSEITLPVLSSRHE